MLVRKFLATHKAYLHVDQALAATATVATASVEMAAMTSSFMAKLSAGNLKWTREFDPHHKTILLLEEYMSDEVEDLGWE